MALFSLLIALLLERTHSFGTRWQFEYWFERAITKITRTLEPTALLFQLIVLILPAGITYFLLQWCSQLLYGLLSLILWVVVAVVSISCFNARQRYKHYLLSVCHGDTQASYLIAAQLAEVKTLDVSDPTALGAQVGRQLVWINYRYYCATALMMVIGGPVAVIFYVTVRSYDLLVRRDIMPRVGLIDTLLFLIDWLPARLVALGYVIVGNFSHAISLWLSLVIKIKLPAQQLIGDVAMIAEQVTAQSREQSVSKEQSASREQSTSSGVEASSERKVCMVSTCRLVALAKQNLILLVSVVALLTIIGLLA